LQRFKDADNMTDRFHALSRWCTAATALATPALARFHAHVPARRHWCWTNGLRCRLRACDRAGRMCWRTVRQLDGTTRTSTCATPTAHAA
jgi:aminopeptidase N